jgi:hypothetical protein
MGASIDSTESAIGRAKQRVASHRERLILALGVLLVFFTALAVTVKASGYLHTLGAITLGAIIVLGSIWERVRPVGPKRATVPLVFWMRRFDDDTSHAHRTQLSIEWSMVDSCVVFLANRSVGVDAETRLMGDWRTIAVVFALCVIAGLFESDPYLRFGLPVLMAIGYITMALWQRFEAQPLGTTIDSRHAFQEALDAIRSRRIFRRSLVFRCPDENEQWRTVVEDLVPRIDAAVISQRDLHWAEEMRARTATTKFQHGLVKELDWVLATLGPEKTVLLLDPESEPPPDSARRGMRVCRLPRRSWHAWPLLPSITPLVTEIQIAIELPLEGAAAPQLSSRGWNSEDDTPRPWSTKDDRPRTWWQRLGIVCIACASVVPASVLAIIGAKGVGPAITALLGVSASQDLVRTAAVGDSCWRLGFLYLMPAAWLSAIFWFWRHRPLSRELVVEYLSGLAFIFMLAGINCSPDPVPRHPLAYANLALAFCGWQTTRTLRKVAPATMRGASVRIIALFGFLFVGTLTPLLMAMLLLAGHVAAEVAMPLSPHPATVASALVAGAYSVWIFRTDRRLVAAPADARSG